MRSQEGRNAQLVRILDVLRDLDRLGGVDIYDLAAKHGTSTRTIRRDLDALAEAGLPLKEEGHHGKKKRWRVAYKDPLQKVSKLLDATHYLALRVAMGQGGAVRGTSSLFATLEDLSEKIEGALGPTGRAQLEAIEACFHSWEKFAYRESPPDVLWPLVQAIASQHVCRVTYRAPRPQARDTEFDILPLRVFAHDGAAYLMCHVPKHGNLATLNLQRVQSLKVLDQQADAPAEFDPNAMENAAFGVFSGGTPTTFVLRFHADAAPYIRERIWHTSQKLEDLPDGGVELSFTCAESYEVRGWIASWLDNVEVVEPIWLRGEFYHLGHWLTETYRPEGRRR